MAFLATDTRPCVLILIPVDILYLDFRKAFDTVPHCRLFIKLAAYGIRGKLLDWIKSFLTN